jgi:glutamate dehydrogenase
LQIGGYVNLYSGYDIVRLAQRRKGNIIDVARLYFAVGSRFRLGRLQAAAENINSDNHWEQLAVAALVEEIRANQLELARRVLGSAAAKLDVAVSIAAWIDKNRAAVEPTEQLLAEIWAGELNDLSMVMVASRQVRGMIDASV